MIETLATYQSLAWTAFAVAVVATPLAMRVARRLDVMDHPDQFLKPHARPTPFLGGSAILLGWSVAVFLAWAQGLAPAVNLLTVWGGGLAVGIMGLIDDAREIPPKLRLSVAAAVTLVVMWTTGVGFDLANTLTAALGFTLPTLVAAPLSVVVSLFIVLGAINATNLIDGLDGLCAGVTTIISLAFAVLAALLLQSQDAAGEGVRLALSLALGGATLGFLIFNFNPARIFMGDGGSNLVGYVCGILILWFADGASLRWLIAALMIFTLPVFDTALAIFRRYRSGKPLFVGDRSHFYDQLVQRGYTVKQTALICYATTALFALAGLTLALPRGAGYLIADAWVLPFFLAFAVIVALISFLSGFTNPPAHTASPKPVGEERASDRA